MIAVVIVAAAGAVLAVAGGGSGGGGHEASLSTSPTSTMQGATPADRPAPWGAAAVPRSAVPPSYVDAWDRARNHMGCALLFPIEGGPALKDAAASREKTPDDNGWDILLTGGAGTVEVLGLFGPDSRLNAAPDTPTFTRSWSDGSVARYAADVGNIAPGTFDPGSAPVEAVVTVPGQRCAYRIYDTLGRAHLEALFDRLRLMRG